MIPGTSDQDVKIGTKKYGEITLAELRDKDPDYLVWVISKSKQSNTIKYAAIRIVMGLPYTVPEEGAIYENSLFFDVVNFKDYAKQLNISI